MGSDDFSTVASLCSFTFQTCFFPKAQQKIQRSRHHKNIQKPFVAEELSLKPMTAALKRNISGKVDGTCCE